MRLRGPSWIKPVGSGLVLLVFVIVLFRFLENALIFYPDRALVASPRDIGLTYEDVWIIASDGIKIHGWFLPSVSAKAPPTAYLLFLHGNAGNISHRLDNLAGLTRAGLAVLIIDYRGYGRSEGRPSEKGTYLDARAAYQYLRTKIGVEPGQIVIFGRSLGGAVAVDLAIEAPARALILESTFTSIRDMARVHFPFLPGFFVSDMYESEKKIGRITTPTLFVHGEKDDLVPIALGRRLFQAHPGPKEFFAIPRAGHNDTFLVGGSLYYQSLVNFVDHPAE